MDCPPYDASLHSFNSQTYCSHSPTSTIIVPKEEPAAAPGRMGLQKRSHTPASLGGDGAIDPCPYVCRVPGSLNLILLIWSPVRASEDAVML